MSFKVGDKVKFLNETGGGTVIAVVDHRLVKVETDDGFEMPVLTTNLIPDFRSMPATEQRSANSSRPAVEVLNESVMPEPSAISEINPWGRVKEAPGVYLAFEPHEQQWLLTGKMDVVLVNHTPMELLYSLFMQQGEQLQGVDYGSVPAHSKLVLEAIEHDEVEQWSQGMIQLLFHADEPDQVYLPVHVDIDVKANRFFKEGSFVSNTLLHGKALLVNLQALSALIPAGESQADRKYRDAVTQAKSSAPRKKAAIDAHRTAQGEATVDLHIGELVDNITGLSSHDMFTLQMNTFREMLESAIGSEYDKVTFIHGVGNGVLKNAIIKALDDYQGLENNMASISKFGVGAIDIVIKRKNE